MVPFLGCGNEILFLAFSQAKSTRQSLLPRGRLWIASSSASVTVLTYRLSDVHNHIGGGDRDFTGIGAHALRTGIEG
ncbi:MAG: hypothetical protein WCP23_05610, partial [Planctomycetota bacterium]